MQGRAELPLHRSIYEQLLREIEDGRWKIGDRLPSEALLCERFSASRITVAKAIGQLQREGRVRRRAGSGTFVQQPSSAGGTALRFGLLIPDLGLTEIFEPMCRGMMTSPLARPHSLTWGHTAEDAESAEAGAEDLCRQFIAQRVTGVFFAPLEYSADRHAANLRVVTALEKAGIAIVLLDRCLEPFPRRSKYDLIGIDNHPCGGDGDGACDHGGIEEARVCGAQGVGRNGTGAGRGVHGFSACSGPGIPRHRVVRRCGERG